MEKLFEIDEILDSIMPDQINLKSFEQKKELNQKIWHDGLLDNKVRINLLKIANEFCSFLKVNWAKPIDAIFVGSLAGYNWSKYSDIDLHVVYNFSDIDENTDLVKNYFTAKKCQWNDQHKDLKIFGYDVELYVQDKNEENASQGVYSIKNNIWIKFPKCEDLLLNKQLIKQQAATLMNKIDMLNEKEKSLQSKETIKRLYDKVCLLYDTIITGRRNGLAEEGEKAAGNIVFKVLRRTKHLEKLNLLKTKLYDKIYSI